MKLGFEVCGIREGFCVFKLHMYMRSDFSGSLIIGIFISNLSHIMIPVIDDQINGHL